MAEWMTQESEVKCPAHEVLLGWMGSEVRENEHSLFFRCPGGEEGSDIAPHELELVFMIEEFRVKLGVRERMTQDVTVLSDEEMRKLDGEPASTEGGSPPEEIVMGVEDGGPEAL